MIQLWQLGLYKACKFGALQQLKKEIDEYTLDIAAIQEVCWHGKGIMDTGNLSFFWWSCKVMFGTAFASGETV